MTATVHSIVKLYPPNAVSRVAVAMRGARGNARLWQCLAAVGATCYVVATFW